MNGALLELILLCGALGFLWASCSIQSVWQHSVLVQWQCTHLPGWVPGVGMIPRLWRTADGVLQTQEGLTALEAGQKRTWQQMMSGASSSSRPDFTDAALQSAYEAPWMRPSQLRQHPLQRAANAAAVLTSQRQQQLAAPAVAGPAHNDLADPLTGLQQQPEEEAPWKAAYGRAGTEATTQDLEGVRLAVVAQWSVGGSAQNAL